MEIRGPGCVQTSGTRGERCKVYHDTVGRSRASAIGVSARSLEVEVERSSELQSLIRRSTSVARSVAGRQTPSVICFMENRVDESKFFMDGFVTFSTKRTKHMPNVEMMSSSSPIG